MSNIDKQALRLTAEKAKDNFMPNFMVPTRDVLALLDELEAAENRIAEPVSVPDLKPVGFLFVSDDGAVAYSPAGLPMKGFNLIGPIYGDVNACSAAMLQAGNHTEQHLDMVNSPVIPDGWQLVPTEPTTAMNKAGWAAINEHDEINPTYRAMLAAAPQHEVKK